MIRIPEKGWSKDEVAAGLAKLREHDLEWRNGRTWAYVYDAGREHEDVKKDAFMAFLNENSLDPTVFPSLLQMENDVVGMMASHLNAPDEAVGAFTSGGTESIFMAVKSARDYARKERGIAEPQIILPHTAHASFQKAAYFLDIEAVVVPVNKATFRADVSAMRDAVNDNTIMLVGSACSYAHGVIDPIAEIAALAKERDLLLHVDGCIGAFVLPYFKRLGRDVIPFDFAVDGVTSISIDLHKYGYAGKGSSCVIFSRPELRKHHLYACAGWAGYTVINTTIQSTKSGGPLASSWAVLNYFGDEGYLELCREMLEATDRICAGIEAIPELRLMAQPESNLISFTSDTVSVFHIVDEMKLRGWFIQPQLASETGKENIHLSVGPRSVDCVDDLLADLRDAIDAAKDLPSGQLAAMMQDAIASLGGGISEEVLGQMMAMAGVSGSSLPDRLADVNEILNAMPADVRSELLVEYFNTLYVPTLARG